MQKLQRSFKLLSKIPRNLSNTNSFLEAYLCKNFSVSLIEINPKQLFNSSVTQPHSFSYFCFNSSRSWRSHHSVSQRFSGFIANPAFVKQLVSNTHLKIRSRSVFDRGVLFLKAQFPKRHFEINPFNSWQHRWRSWFPTAENVVLGLITANVAICMLWTIADRTFMRKNFMISVENFTSGRVHTLITSAFSHIEADHLVSNMIGLYFFGKSIGNIFGPAFVLKLYLAGAVGDSIFYLVHHAFMASSSKGSGRSHVDHLRISGLSASGAVNAFVLLHIFLFPTATLYYNFFIPAPAMLVGAFFIGKDIWRMMKGKSQISGSAHLGGAVVAALAWARIKKRWI